MHVSTSTKEKRKYDKLNACYYCERLCTDVRKHLVMVHKKEKDIQLLESKPLRSKERGLVLEKTETEGKLQAQLCSSPKGTWRTHAS